MKKIILCADDYGQSAAISAGILHLIERGRLSATSCMTDSEFWSSTDNRLCEFRDRVDIGVHFNLTHELPAQTIPAQSLSVILRTALMGRIDKKAIASTLNNQLDRFEKVMGQAPDFVDGHQHVHVFPGIRSVVLQQLAQRYKAKKPYLRAVNPRLPGHGGLLKLAFLKLLSSGFSSAAARLNMSTNSGFAGIYSLQPQQNFALLMKNWMHEVRDGDLLMCHPGFLDSASDDPIAATRPLELAFLQSAEFENLLATTNVTLARLRDR
ncbi:MAG: hypothetical protein JWM78_755 [Verrucomicrobiaceae bacterium]|nr:hypothetical protein [Verrucomicrobiaceae bacterium]